LCDFCSHPNNKQIISKEKMQKRRSLKIRQNFPQIKQSAAFILLPRQQKKKRTAIGQSFQRAALRANAQEKEKHTMKGEFTQKGKEALERFKMESANEVGVTLKQGYNGDLTSRQAGSIGGQMVKKMIDAYKMQ